LGADGEIPPEIPLEKTNLVQASDIDGIIWRLAIFPPAAAKVQPAPAAVDASAAAARASAAAAAEAAAAAAAKGEADVSGGGGGAEGEGDGGEGVDGDDGAADTPTGDHSGKTEQPSLNELLHLVWVGGGSGTRLQAADPARPKPAEEPMRVLTRLQASMVRCSLCREETDELG
jgi:hypothetical protein